MHLVRKYFHHRSQHHPDAWHPFMTFFYLTTACGFKCPYCQSGPFLMEGVVTPQQMLRGEALWQLLATIRRHTDLLVITGGEPLCHPDIKRVLERVRDYRFRSIILASNGFAIDRYLETIATVPDYLVVSLDTLEEGKGDRLAGCAPGAARQVLANLEALIKHPRRRAHISISGVVTPDNLDDLYDVYRWTQERGLEFAAAPQLVGVQAHPELVGSDRYRRFYDFLLREKRRGARIYGTVRYLEHLRDLSPFRCYPLTYLVVSPLGDVWYPCLEGGRVVGNLLAEPDVDALARRGRTALGAQGRRCAEATQCHSACMVSVSLLLEHPGDLIGEGWRRLRGAGRRVAGS